MPLPLTSSLLKSIYLSVDIITSSTDKMQQMAQCSISWLPRDKLMCNNTTVRSLLRFLWAKYILLLIAEFAVDPGIGLCWPKPTLPFLTTSPCISITNALAWRAIEFCACENTQLYSVLFYDVTAVYKFHSMLVIKETLDIWWPVERTSCGDRDLGYDRICILPRSSSRLLRESTQVVKVNCILLSSELCLCFWNSPPVDVIEWWCRNESATCRKMLQGVRKCLNDVHNADTTFRHSTPVTYVNESCMVEPVMENRRGNQIQNKRNWKQLYCCKHRNDDFREKWIFFFT